MPRSRNTVQSIIRSSQVEETVLVCLRLVIGHIENVCQLYLSLGEKNYRVNKPVAIWQQSLRESKYNINSYTKIKLIQKKL